MKKHFVINEEKLICLCCFNKDKTYNVPKNIAKKNISKKKHSYIWITAVDGITSMCQGGNPN